MLTSGAGWAADGEEVERALRQMLPTLTAFETTAHHGGRTTTIVCDIESAAQVFDALAEFGDALAGIDVACWPSRVSTLADPPMVAMSFHGGAALAELLVEAVQQDSPEALAHSRTAVGAAGTALATMHDRLIAVDGSERDVVELARRLYRTSAPRDVDAELPCRRVTDFATYNMLLDTSSGMLQLVDPPRVREMTTRHEDLAYFLLTLMNSTVGVTPRRSRRRGLSVYCELSTRFLRSYSDAARAPLSRPGDADLVALLAGYHAAVWGWRRTRRSRGLRRAGVNALAWSARTRRSSSGAPWLIAD